MLSDHMILLLIAGAGLIWKIVKVVAFIAIIVIVCRLFA